MPQQIRIWEVGADDSLQEMPVSELDQEARLQAWLERDISIVADDLLVIGKEVKTAFGGRIDLLCIDARGDLVVIELKRDKTPRDVTAQVLDYASWVNGLTVERINDLAKDYLSDADTLDEAFRGKFGEEPPDTLNLNHRLFIVASEMDDSTERIVRYLSDAGIDINVVTFQHFSASDGKELMARVFLIEPTEAEAKAAATSKRAKYITEETFLSRVDNEEYGRILKRLFHAFRELNLNYYRGTKGVSFRIPGSKTALPITVAWMFPPKTSGWMGLTDVTMGYDPASLKHMDSATPLFDEYVQSLESVPGSIPENRGGLKAFHLNPKVVVDSHRELESILRRLVAQLMEAA